MTTRKQKHSRQGREREDTDISAQNRKEKAL
jgi:hypothetical protein